MELKLVNGDYLPDGRGGLQQAEEEILQRALSRLTARRGSFPFLPEFGSRLCLLLCRSAAGRAEFSILFKFSAAFSTK